MKHTNINTQIVSGSNTPDVFDQLDKLNGDRAAWEVNAFKRSNDELYDILARCLDVYQIMMGDLKLRKQLKKKLTELNLPYNEGTSTATLVVRYVFRSTGKRVFAYAKAIDSAHEQNIDPMRFPSWIIGQGGVEEVRRASNGISASTQSAEYIAEADEYYSECEPLSPGFKAEADLLPHKDSDNKFSVALVRHEADGSVAIVCGANNNALVKQMLKIAGKRLAEHTAIKNSENTRRRQKSDRAKAASAA